MLRLRNKRPIGGIGMPCIGRPPTTPLPSGRCATPTGGPYWGCVTLSTVSGRPSLLVSSNASR
eukprot:5280739-Lingulodinium_polyedra.AAC.1